MNLYHHLFETAHEALLILQDGLVVDINAMALTLLGGTRESWCGQALPHDERVIQAKIEAALAGEAAEFSCSCHRSDDGQTIYVQLTFQRLESTEGTFIRVSIQQETLNEIFYRHLMEEALVGVYILQDNRFVYVNPKLLEIFGYAPEDVDTLKLADIVLAEDLPLVIESVKKRYSSEAKNLGYTFRARRKDGTILELEVKSAKAMYHGRAAVIGTIVDITEQRQLAQQALVASERRARQVQTSTEIAQRIAMAPALEQLFRQVVNLVQERFGYTSVSLYALSGDKLVMQEAAPLLNQVETVDLADETSVIAQAARTGRSVLSSDTVDDISHSLDGWLDSISRLSQIKAEIAVPIHLDNEVWGVLDVQNEEAHSLSEEDELLLIGLSGQVASAITSTHLLEEANVFRQFAEASGQGFGMSTLDNNIVYFNPTAARVLGIADPKDVYGQPAVNFYHAEMRHAYEYEFLPAVLMDGQWSGETKLQAVDGRIIPVLENLFLIRDERGQPYYFANVFTDITERKQIETEMANRLRELTTLQRLMTQEGWQAIQSEREQGYLFDPQETPSEFKNPQDLESAGTITVPMTVRGEMVGTLGVYDDPTQPLSPEDHDLLQSISVQVAEALENARLLEQVQKRAIELETVAQVSTAVSTILEPQKLLQTVVDLTKSSFGLYHAHIYLFNEADQTLDLAAGAGEVGQQMVATGWRISMERTQSVVAQAAKTRQGKLVNDVRATPNFLPNPLLPNTRAEMAVPLLLGEDKVLGVLDVQSEQVNRFTEDDLRIQGTLAAQVAVALQNANLLARTQAALLEAQAIQRRYTLQSWEDYRHRHTAHEFSESKSSEVLEPSELSALHVPLKVRGETIGLVGLEELSEAGHWTEEESAFVQVIAERVAQTAENLRLFDETQQRAAREARANEIGKKIRAAQSLEEAMQIAIKEVGLSLKAPRTVVQLGLK